MESNATVNPSNFKFVITQRADLELPLFKNILKKSFTVENVKHIQKRLRKYNEPLYTHHSTSTFITILLILAKLFFMENFILVLYRTVYHTCILETAQAPISR